MAGTRMRCRLYFFIMLLELNLFPSYSILKKERYNMRALFTAIVILEFCACVRSKYYDLRHPIYIETDESFWSGCEADPASEEACHTFRVNRINDGIYDWFRHFDEATRPQAIVVGSKAELPADRINKRVIILRIEAGGCGKGNSACYSSGLFWPTEIVFDDPKFIFSSVIAHEFGHVLGLVEHHDTQDEIYSIMLPVVEDMDYVLPVDIELLCRIHTECPPHEDTWCEGGFYDECLCPSASYEEAKAALEAEELACME